jgi:hypothetical protein
LLEEGYFDGIAGGRDVYGMPSLFVCRHLNMRAHEFLAHTRNNTIWKKVLAEAKEKGLSTSAMVVSKLAEGLAKKFVGIE